MCGYAGTPSFPAVEAHTEHRVLVRGDGGPIVPPPPDPGDLAGKYGVQAPAKDFEATLLGPNPTPGDSTLGTLSQDRSPRSESYARWWNQAILPWARYRRIDPLGLRQYAWCTGHSWTGFRLNDRYRYPVPGAWYRDPVRGPGTRSIPGESDQVMLSKDRSPRSESIYLVERSSFCETGSNARLAMKGSVQQSSVNRPEDSEHVPVIPGPGSGLMTGTRFRYPVSRTLFSRPHQVHRVLPVIPGDSVTPGDSVRPVFSGQEAQKEKIDKCLDGYELPVLNSPGSSVQLEYNVHKQQGNMPNSQAEHWSEYSEVFQDVTNSDSSNVKAY